MAQQSVISFVAVVLVIATVLFPYGTVAANVAETSLYLKRFMDLLRNDITRNDILSNNVEYNYAQCVFVNNIGLDTVTAAKNDVVGIASLSQATTGGPLQVSIDVKGIDPKSPLEHGFHVHQYGDLSDGCASTGGHFNPHNKEHGAPQDTERHVGDWGNVKVNKGEVKVMLEDNVASLMEADMNNIIGRGIVLHAGTDDLGQGGDAESKKTGNAGARLACCVIGLAPQPAQ